MPRVRTRAKRISDKFGHSNCIILREAHMRRPSSFEFDGNLNVETVPGLDRHFRNVLTAALSSRGSPVLSAINASIDLLELFLCSFALGLCGEFVRAVGVAEKAKPFSDLRSGCCAERHLNTLEIMVIHNALKSPNYILP